MKTQVDLPHAWSEKVKMMNDFGAGKDEDDQRN